MVEQCEYNMLNCKNTAPVHHIELRSGHTLSRSFARACYLGGVVKLLLHNVKNLKKYISRLELVTRSIYIFLVYESEFKSPRYKLRKD